jgi:hypothetical protein
VLARHVRGNERLLKGSEVWIRRGRIPVEGHEQNPRIQFMFGQVRYNNRSLPSCGLKLPSDLLRKNLGLSGSRTTDSHLAFR